MKIRRTVASTWAAQFSGCLICVLTAGLLWIAALPVAAATRFGHRPPAQMASAQARSAVVGPAWNITFPLINYTGPLVPYRIYHSGVYDPGSNRLIVFGGQDENGNPQNDVFLFTQANGNGGTEGGQGFGLTVGYPLPAPRYSHSAVYDKTNNRMIVFGGCADFECQIALNDTWVLTDANGVSGTSSWVELSPNGPLPSPRDAQSVIYDDVNNRMIVYGGSDISDVWVLSNANGLGGTPAWSQLFPAGGPPDSLDGASVVYDSANNIAIFFGGYFVNSVWTLSHANGLGATPGWTNLILNGAAGSPAPRAEHTAVYDSTNNRMMIYAGSGDFGTDNPDLDFGVYGDVWVLSAANGLAGPPVWTQLHPKGLQPVPRTGHVATYDAATNRMTVFAGGSVEGTFVSTWVLYDANGL